MSKIKFFIIKLFLEKLYNFSDRFIQVLSVIFSGILLLCGFLTTSYSINMETQLVLSKWDSPLRNIAEVTLFLLLTGLLMHAAKRNIAFAKKLLFATTSLWILGMGAILIVFSKTVPAADAYSVYEIASFLAKGDTSVIHSTNSYLSYYPQQIGLVSFLEPLIRLWNLLSLGLPAYHFLKIIYVFLGLLIFYFQYRTVHLLFQNDRTDCIFMILMGANLPFIMYTSFVYGEIPSFAALSIALYSFLRMLSALAETHNRLTAKYAILSLIFFTVSVALRKNSLIIIIAVVLVSCLLWCRHRRPLLLLFAALCAICAVSILPLIQKGYELRGGDTLRSGVTATSYFAMGMQESSRANGWYNGFNFNTYQYTGMDTELTNEISRAAILERLHYFKENPVYAVNFYLQKFLSQWTDGTYACRQATLATFGGRHSLFCELYDGKYSRAFIAYCNLFQNIIYLGLFICCVGIRKNKIEVKHSGLPCYLGLIGVFGGFLFHMLWEANSRYIFLYGMLMLPYASAGIEACLTTVTHFRINLLTKK